MFTEVGLLSQQAVPRCVFYFHSKNSIWFFFISCIYLLRLSISLTRLSIFSLISSLFIITYCRIFMMATSKSLSDNTNPCQIFYWILFKLCVLMGLLWHQSGQRGGMAPHYCWVGQMLTFSTKSVLTLGKGADEPLVTSGWGWKLSSPLGLC